MMPKPTHAQALKAWSAVTEDFGESCVLILPQSDGVYCSAFRPNDEHGMAEHLTEIVRVLKVEGMIAEALPWSAVVAPAFIQMHVDGPMPAHGDLQKAYTEGDMRVREVVTVLVMDMDGPPWAQTFSQPLLEPLDTPAIITGGEMSEGLTAAMVMAGLD